MTEKKQVKSSIKKQIQFIFIWGILIGSILGILNSFAFFGFYRCFLLYRVTKWPIVILTGIVIAVIVVVFRRTTVLVTKDSVVIRKIGQKVQFSIDEFEAADIKRKEDTIWLIKIVIIKVYLRFRNTNGTKAYRLFDFSEMDIEQVLQLIREQHSNNMPIEGKIEVLDSLKDDTPFNVFLVSSAHIRQYERKTILKIGGIWFILSAAVLIFILFDFVDGGMETFEMIFLLFLLCILLAAVPIQLLWLSGKVKHCPEIIRINENAMWIGEKYFSYTGISYIKMTSPRKKSDSIFPVQYWMTVKGNGEKLKYWLGSQASFGEYKELCKTLEQAMLMRSNKLIYK